MTVDVEDYFHVTALSRVINRGDWDTLEYRAESSTRRLLALFASKEVKATFFVLGWVAKRSPALVREIQAAGHEVACHGMNHQLIYTQTPEEFRKETRDSKALLEDITGAPVIGYRAATYSITLRSMWALDVILEAGFKYDSSIFPIRHDLYGIPDAPTSPTKLDTPKGATIVEFPISTAQFLSMRIPVAGGGYFRIFPYWVTSTGLGRINSVQHLPFVFYLHPWEIDPDQPKVKVGKMPTFRHYTNLSRTEQRLTRLLDRFEFAPMCDVLMKLKLLP